MKELSEQEIQVVSGAADDEQKIAGMIGGIVNGITGLFGFKDIFGSISRLISSIVDTVNNK
ncbi:TPA: hypothetical protein JDL67_003924 [Salmonella enterica subsp. salamae]|nr:hypothetical protein [Salmonella enterica subsp. salamae]